MDSIEVRERGPTDEQNPAIQVGVTKGAEYLEENITFVVESSKRSKGSMLLRILCF